MGGPGDLAAARRRPPLAGPGGLRPLRGGGRFCRIDHQRSAAFVAQADQLGPNAFEFVADKIPYVDSTWDAISTALSATTIAIRIAPREASRTASATRSR